MYRKADANPIGSKIPAKGYLFAILNLKCLFYNLSLDRLGNYDCHGALVITVLATCNMIFSETLFNSRR